LFNIGEDTIEWINAQDEVTSNYLKAIPFREKIANRLTELRNYTPASFRNPREVDHYQKKGIVSKN